LTGDRGVLMNSDPVFILCSGEKAQVEVISRSLAKEILSKPARRQTWFGEKYWSAHRTSRGPGGAADYLNLALGVGQKYRAVMRFGTAPWGNSPVVAAVGPELAPRCSYLMRLWGSGISHAHLVEFIRQANRR